MSGQVSNNLLLEAINVTVSRERPIHVPVRGVDWRAHSGEFWVIGGPHGSGKTALLNTVAGLRRPAEGTVRHFGRELASLSEHDLLELRTRIGYVFKGGGRIFADLSVADNVSLPLRYHRDWTPEQAQPAAREILEATDLASLAGESAETLNPGLQQRVGLARALILQPEILFLDEPFAGLDAAHRRWWRQFLTGLTEGRPPLKRPIAVVAATNDFSLWTGHRHYFGVIRDGRWHAIGEAAEPPELE